MESAFREKFDTELDLPEVVGDHHALLVVASEIDETTERIIHYLSKNDVDINAVRFQFFKGEGHQLLVRTFTVAPGQPPPGRKRRKVPTAEEMEQRAVNAGVREQYLQVSQALVPPFKTVTTKTTLVFQAKFKEGLRATFSLVPGESNSETGLRYTVYSKPLAALVGLDENAIPDELPAGREPWQGVNGKGWAGYIKNEDDLRRIASLLKRASGADTQQAA